MKIKTKIKWYVLDTARDTQVDNLDCLNGKKNYGECIYYIVSMDYPGYFDCFEMPRDT